MADKKKPFYQQFTEEGNRWAEQEAHRRKETGQYDFDRLNAIVTKRLEEKKKRQEYENSREGRMANSRYADIYRQLGLLTDRPYEPKVKETAVPDVTGTVDTGTGKKDTGYDFSAFNQAPEGYRKWANDIWGIGRQATDQKGNLLKGEDGQALYQNKLWLSDERMPEQKMQLIAREEDKLSGTPLEQTTAINERLRENRENRANTILDAMSYANARGSQALDAFNTNLNILGEQAWEALKAAFGTAQNDKQSSVVLPSVWGNEKPVLTTGLKSPEEINQTAGASEGFTGQLKNNIREANTAVLERALAADRNAKTLADVEKSYPISKNKVVQALGDLSATISGQVPAIITSASTGLLGGALLRGATSSVDAYIEARKDGASAAQAKKYASREAINQGIGDILLTGIAGSGKGVLARLPVTSKAGRYLARAYGTTVTSPAAKTAIRYFGNMLGEGVEEALQNAVTTANKRLSYSPDARVNPREMLYEGILGAAAAGIFGAANIPESYRVYKSDVDTVNEISKAAGSVQTEEEARLVKLNADILTDWCNLTINDPSVDFDTRARNEYIKAGIAKAMDEMEANLESVIHWNESVDEAFEDIADAPADDIAEEVADLVTVVGENTDPEEDVIRATVDRVREEIRDIQETEQQVASMKTDEFTEWLRERYGGEEAFNEWFRETRMTGPLAGIDEAARNPQTNLLTGPTTPFNTQTAEAVRPRVLRELEIQRMLWEKVDDFLRNHKGEVKTALTSRLASPDTGLQFVPESGIIGESAGNPVMMADGKSLVQPDNAVPEAEGKSKFDLVHREIKHTQTGEKLNLYEKPKRYLSGDDYKELANAVKSVGGRWSSFSKGFIVPDEGVPKLADALKKIGVGIDESQYKPIGAQTSQTVSPAEPDAGEGPAVRPAAEPGRTGEPLPQFEVPSNSADTVTAERPKGPVFEIPEQGGDLVPANGTTAVQGNDAAAPDVRSEAGTGSGSGNASGGQTAPDANVNPPSGAPAGGKVQVNAEKKDDDEEKKEVWTPQINEKIAEYAQNSKLPESVLRDLVSVYFSDPAQVTDNVIANILPDDLHITQFAAAIRGIRGFLSDLRGRNTGSAAEQEKEETPKQKPETRQTPGTYDEIVKELEETGEYIVGDTTYRIYKNKYGGYTIGSRIDMPAGPQEWESDHWALEEKDEALKDLAETILDKSTSFSLVRSVTTEAQDVTDAYDVVVENLKTEDDPVVGNYLFEVMRVPNSMLTLKERNQGVTEAYCWNIKEVRPNKNGRFNSTGRNFGQYVEHYKTRQAAVDAMMAKAREQKLLDGVVVIKKEPEPPKRTTPARTPKEGYMKFASDADYSDWVDQYEELSLTQMVPILIDDGKKVSADMFVKCKTATTAVDRFIKAFGKVKEFDGWLEEMKEAVEMGTFKQEDHDKEWKDSYSWEVEWQDDNLYYVFLNVRGIYAGREDTSSAAESAAETEPAAGTASESEYTVGEVVEFDGVYYEVVSVDENGEPKFIPYTSEDEETSEEEESSAYAVGDIVEYKGKNYRIVEFADDGSPVLEEYRKPRSSGNVRYALEAPERITLSLNEFQTAVKSNQIRKVSSAGGVKSAGKPAAPKAPAQKTQSSAPIKLSDLMKKAGDGAGIRKITDKSELSGIRNGKRAPEPRKSDSGRVPQPAARPSAPAKAEPYTKIADWVQDRLKRQLSIEKSDLQVIANDAYGGTMSEGKYTVKDMTDALELGVNRYIIDKVSRLPKTFNGPMAVHAADALDSIERSILDKIPTQTNRSDEQIALQQFSTPPNIAYLANWVANIDDTDTVLEPSAGIGGLASFAKGMGAQVIVNELSDRRLDLLKTLPFDGFYHENAEQIDNILPDDVKPTVVVMNPPFSANGRTKNKTANAIPHIEQALDRLEDGGRLVAILGGGRDAGGGMSDSAPSFKSWWNGLRDTYDIRANVGIDGKNYKKYGTSFNVRLVVIDKTGPQEEPTLTGEYEDLDEAIKDLEEIRNDRQHHVVQTGRGGERNGAVEGSGNPSAGTEGGNRNRPDGGGRTDSGAGTSGTNQSGSASGGKSAGGVLPGERAGSAGELGDVHAEKPVQSPDKARGGERGGKRGESGGNSAAGESGQTGGVESGGARGVASDESGELVQSGSDVKSEKPQSAANLKKGDGEIPASTTEADEVAPDSTAIYADYKPTAKPFANAVKHPAKLVESAAMSAVKSPKLTRIPNIPENLVESGALSDAQLENIAYAGQAHQEKLPSGVRKGYFIGDGTGVGKGREICGIILDSFNTPGSKKKAVWVSEKWKLFSDAKRDWGDMGRSPDEVIDFRKARDSKKGFPNEGIIFITYDTLKSVPKTKGKKTNLQLIEEWLGKDSDGDIIFDEAHNMGGLLKKNSKGEDGTQKARAADQLQTDMTNAKVTYLSATGATEIDNFAYLSRLGLWGPRTAFSSALDFTYKIGSSGISALELVARDMKAQGLYLARSISYEDVKYDTLNHDLTKGQRAMYDRWCDAWQTVLQHVDKAMALTGTEKSQVVRRRKAQIFSNLQNFYNQTITSMMTPEVIKDIERELAAGHSCVIQLTNTNEAILDKELLKRHQQKLDDDEDFDDLDLTPRDLLIGYVENAFPIEQYVETTGPNGTKIVEPVVDSEGKPVINKKALALKNELLEDLKDIAVPEGPLDMILNHFGIDNVAEVTGRSKRVVSVTDNNGNTKKTKLVRDPAKDNEAETRAFQDGKKRILIFSTAGSTGSSYHADKRAKNQQQRIHYILQPGWRADIATQGFGRTHRSNEVSAPVYRLVTTNIPGQKRFVTSIARRLDSLGALTKGDSKAGAGVFDERDNLETTEAKNALETLYTLLLTGRVSGLDGFSILNKMGLLDKFTDKNTNNVKIDPEEARNMTRFLNRMLVLRIDEQEKLFERYRQLQENEISKAKEAGTLDRGVEGISADKIVINSKQTVYTDPRTGAETQYVKATLYDKPRVANTVQQAKNAHLNFEGIYRDKRDGSVKALYRTTDMTDEKTGNVYKRFRVIGPNQSVESIYKADTIKTYFDQIPESEWETEWAKELKNVPEYVETEIHMITGTLLPIWGKLTEGNESWRMRARRLTSSDGKQSYLGVLIGANNLARVLRQLNINESAAPKKSGKELRDLIMKQNKVVTFNGQYGGVLTVGKRRVANESRMEISGPNMMRLTNEIEGIIKETVNYDRRYFIPDNAIGEEILDKLAKEGIRSIDNRENTGNLYSAGLSDGKWGSGNRDKEAQVKSISDLVKEAQRIFGIPINAGKLGAVPRSVQGVFKEHPETVRTRNYGDIPTIAHEVGHYFDKKYNLHESPYISELVKEFEDDLEKAGYSPLLYTRESVAEYFSNYMVDRAKTEKKFKKFTKWLNETMSDVDMRKLNDFSAMSNGYFAADQERRAEAQVHYRTEDNSIRSRAQEKIEEINRNPREYFGDLSRTFVRNWFDDLVDLRGFGNTYDLAMYEKTARSVAYGRIVYGMTDKNGNRVGRSLAQILTDAGIDERNIRDFDVYLIARIALDRIDANKRGEEVPTLVYADKELGKEENLIDRIDRMNRENPTFREAAEGIYAYQNQLLDLAVESGLMSDDLRKRLNELYPHYVPLYRVMDDKTQKTRGARRGYEGQDTPIGRFKGSGRDIYSPIENIMLNVEKFTVACMRNDVMMEFADYMDKNEGMGWVAERIPPAMLLQRIDTYELGERLKEFVDQSDMIMAGNDAERAWFWSNLMNFIGEEITQWRPSGKKGHNVVSVMRDGKPQYYEIHDEGVYKALTNLDAPQFDMLTKFFGAMTRFEKGLFTSTNPQFLFTNPARDLVTGFVSSSTTDNPFTYVADFVKALRDAVRGDETYQKYMESGGGYMGSLTSDYNVLRKVSRDVVKDDSKIKSFMNNVVHMVPRLVDAGETASRLAEWKRAIEQGDSNMEAMRKAQEITVNFARGGRVVKRINQYIPFFQAGFSALAHDYDLFVNGGDGGGGRNGNNGFGLDVSPEGKRRRAKAWAKWLLTTLLAALMTWLYNFLIAPKVTGESEEEIMQHWDDLSNYNKNAYYNVYLGNGKFVRIKKTQDMAIPATIIERMIEYTVLDQKDSLNGMADYVFDNVLSISLNPVDVLSDVTLIGPVVNVLRNEDFKGTPIVPKRFEYNTYRTEQYTESTSTLAIGLGQILDASPIQLQFLGESYFGWVARLVNNLTPLNGERSLGLKTKLVADSAYSTDIINNFYTQKKAYDDGANGYKSNPSSKRFSKEDAYGSYKYGRIASLYTDLNRLTREEGDNDLSRDMRVRSNALIQTVNEDGLNDLDRAVIDLADRAGLSDYGDIAPYITIPDKVSVKVGNTSYDFPLDYDDMTLYFNQSQTAFEQAYGQIMRSGYSAEATAAALANAKKVITKQLRDEWKRRLLARRTMG